MLKISKIGSRCLQIARAIDDFKCMLSDYSLFMRYQMRPMGLTITDNMLRCPQICRLVSLVRWSTQLYMPNSSSVDTQAPFLSLHTMGLQKSNANGHRDNEVYIRRYQLRVSLEHSTFSKWLQHIHNFLWASCKIRKIAGCACDGNAGSVSPRHRLKRKALVSDPGMHHGTCATHLPRCMSGSLTRGGGKNVPGIPGACATVILRIW